MFVACLDAAQPHLEAVLEFAERNRHLRVEGHDRSHVFSPVFVVFLAVGLTNFGLAQHNDPGHGAVDLGLPRAFVVVQLSIFVVVDRLAKVPNGPGLVLRIPIPGLLDQGIPFPFSNANDAGSHAHYMLFVVSHRDLDPLIACLVLEQVPGAGFERKELVRDARNEIARDDVHGVAIGRGLARSFGAQRISAQRRQQKRVRGKVSAARGH